MANNGYSKAYSGTYNVGTPIDTPIPEPALNLTLPNYKVPQQGGINVRYGPHAYYDPRTHQYIMAGKRYQITDNPVEDNTNLLKIRKEGGLDPKNQVAPPQDNPFLIQIPDTELEGLKDRMDSYWLLPFIRAKESVSRGHHVINKYIAAIKGDVKTKEDEEKIIQLKEKAIQALPSTVQSRKDIASAPGSKFFNTLRYLSGGAVEMTAGMVPMVEGAVKGGVAGGIAGSIIPGAGTLAGAAVGAKIGAAVGMGESAAAETAREVEIETGKEDLLGATVIGGGVGALSAVAGPMARTMFGKPVMWATPFIGKTYSTLTGMFGKKAAEKLAPKIAESFIGKIAKAGVNVAGLSLETAAWSGLQEVATKAAIARVDPNKPVWTKENVDSFVDNFTETALKSLGLSAAMGVTGALRGKKGKATITEIPEEAPIEARETLHIKPGEERAESTFRTKEPVETIPTVPEATIASVNKKIPEFQTSNKIKLERSLGKDTIDIDDPLQHGIKDFEEHYGRVNKKTGLTEESRRPITEDVYKERKVEKLISDEERNRLGVKSKEELAGDIEALEKGGYKLSPRQLEQLHKIADISHRSTDAVGLALSPEYQKGKIQKMKASFSPTAFYNRPNKSITKNRLLNIIDKAAAGEKLEPVEAQAVSTLWAFKDPYERTLKRKKVIAEVGKLLNDNEHIANGEIHLDYIPTNRLMQIKDTINMINEKGKELGIDISTMKEFAHQANEKVPLSLRQSFNREYSEKVLQKGLTAPAKEGGFTYQVIAKKLGLDEKDTGFKRDFNNAIDEMKNDLEDRGIRYDPENTMDILEKHKSIKKDIEKEKKQQVLFSENMITDDMLHNPEQIYNPDKKFANDNRTYTDQMVSSKDLRDYVRRIAGDEVSIGFSSPGAKHGGYYFTAPDGIKDLITVAMDKTGYILQSKVGHEVWHFIMRRKMTDAEIKYVNNKFEKGGKFYNIVSEAAKDLPLQGEGGKTLKDLIDSLDPETYKEEIFAYTGELVKMGKLSLSQFRDNVVVRTLNKIMQFFKDVLGISNNKFSSIEDMYKSIDTEYWAGREIVRNSKGEFTANYMEWLEDNGVSQEDAKAVLKDVLNNTEMGQNILYSANFVDILDSISESAKATTKRAKDIYSKELSGDKNILERAVALSRATAETLFPGSKDKSRDIKIGCMQLFGGSVEKARKSKIYNNALNVMSAIDGEETKVLTNINQILNPAIEALPEAEFMKYAKYMMDHDYRTIPNKDAKAIGQALDRIIEFGDKYSVNKEREQLQIPEELQGVKAPINNSEFISDLIYSKSKEEFVKKIERYIRSTSRIYFNEKNISKAAKNGMKVDIKRLNVDKPFDLPDMEIATDPTTQRPIQLMDGGGTEMWLNEATNMFNNINFDKRLSKFNTAVKTFTMLYYLGGRVSSGLVNLSSILNVLNNAYKYTNNFGEAFSMTFDSLKYKSYDKIKTALASDRTSVKERERLKALKYAYDSGIIDETRSVLQEEPYKFESGLLGKSMKFITSKGLYPTMLTERINRQSAFLTGFELADKVQRTQEMQRRSNQKVTGPKMETFEDKLQYAKNFTRESVFMFKRYERPGIYNMPVVGTVLMFTQYPLLTAQLLGHLAKTNKKAFASIVGSYLLMSGIQGMPFGEDAMDIIDTVGQSIGFNTNVKREMRMAIKDNLTEDILLGGLGGLLGLSSRIGVGDVLPFTRTFAVDTNLNTKDALGAPGGVLQDLTYINEDNFMSRHSPLVLRDIWKGIRMLNRGYAVNLKGNKITDVPAYQATLQMLGFSPAKVARAYDIDTTNIQTLAYKEYYRIKYRDRLAQALVDKDYKAYNEIKRDMDSFIGGRKYKITVTPKSVREKAKTMTQDQTRRRLKEFGKHPEEAVQ